MYGFALMVRSYSLFALVIISHLLQMGFLSLVETPHIEKIYGRDEPATGSKERVSNFFMPTNFDAFRAGDLSSVLVAGFFGAFCFLGVRWDPPAATCGGSSAHAGCVPAEGVVADGAAGGGDSWFLLDYLQQLPTLHSCVLDQKGVDFWCNTTDGGWGFCNCGRLSSTFFVVNAVFWRFVQTGVTAIVLHFQVRPFMRRAFPGVVGLSVHAASLSTRHHATHTHTHTHMHAHTHTSEHTLPHAHSHYRRPKAGGGPATSLSVGPRSRRRSKAGCRFKTCWRRHPTSASWRQRGTSSTGQTPCSARTVRP